jgi:uncharacterized protein (TIGR02996 family)
VSIESEREAFLSALEANLDDNTTRLVYADWLDENGEHDEATRMRKWPASRAWMLNVVEQFKSDPEDGYPHFGATWEMMLDLGREFVRDGRARCGDNESLADFLNNEHNRGLFLDHWSILTGEAVPEKMKSSSFHGWFGCAC